MDIYCDGSCLGNPGPGGWAYYIPYLTTQGKQATGVGGVAYTTSNRMELTAIWQGLKAISELNTKQLPHNILIVSDSLWSVNVLSLQWKASKNLELIAEIEKLVRVELASRVVSYKWIQGHNGTRGNEIVDQLAHQEALRQKEMLQ